MSYQRVINLIGVIDCPVILHWNDMRGNRGEVEGFGKFILGMRVKPSWDLRALNLLYTLEIYENIKRKKVTSKITQKVERVGVSVKLGSSCAFFFKKKSCTQKNITTFTFGVREDYSKLFKSSITSYSCSLFFFWFLLLLNYF